MTTSPRTAGTNDCCHYRICLSGLLDACWVVWFEQTRFVYDGQHTTLHTGCIDQAALYGLIRRLSNLGLTLISIARESEGA